MAYVDPNTVVAPRTLVSEVEIVYDSSRDSDNEESWSVAKLLWDRKPAVGIRWNGDPGGKGIGTPQAFGQPTWFLVPSELEGSVLEKAEKLAQGGYDALKAGYAEMARDSEHEKEALEWSEGLIGDQTGE
jgi:hypothetical protein